MILRGQQVRLSPLQVVLPFRAAFHAAEELFIDAKIAIVVLKIARNGCSLHVCLQPLQVASPYRSFHGLNLAAPPEARPAAQPAGPPRPPPGRSAND